MPALLQLSEVRLENLQNPQTHANKGFELLSVTVQRLAQQCKTQGDWFVDIADMAPGVIAQSGSGICISDRHHVHV